MSLLHGECKAVRDADVVRLHAEQTCDERTVGAVAGAGSGKRTGECDLCSGWLPAEQPPGDQPDPDGACRMGAGRADHDRPEDIKNVHESSFLYQKQMQPNDRNAFRYG